MNSMTENYRTPPLLCGAGLLTVLLIAMAPLGSSQGPGTVLARISGR